MRKNRVEDLQNYPINERRLCLLHLTPDTERCLDALSEKIIERLESQPLPNKGLKKREIQKLKELWKDTAPQPVKNRYQMIAMAKGFHEAAKYWDAEFLKAHPECSEIPPQGRPRWYIHPSRIPRVARGEVLSLLINLAGDRLLRQLSAEQPSAEKSA